MDEQEIEQALDAAFDKLVPKWQKKLRGGPAFIMPAKGTQARSIVNLLNKGYSAREVAYFLGIETTIVRSQVRRLGVSVKQFPLQGQKRYHD